jgi:hypothetical protein
MMAHAAERAMKLLGIGQATIGLVTLLAAAAGRAWRACAGEA